MTICKNVGTIFSEFFIPKYGKWDTYYEKRVMNWHISTIIIFIQWILKLGLDVF
jgi:hypothetical protein